MEEEGVFDREPFAQGRFRYAYRGEVTVPLYKAGQQIVVKILKDSYTWEPTDWDTTIQMYENCQAYASEFNRSTRFGMKVEFATCQNAQVTSNYSNSDEGPQLGEWVVYEPYLVGTFMKWCNNYGYVSTEARGVDSVLTSFMHWTWYMSGGQEMMGDIQGVKQHDRYVLTDPAMLSVTNQYGATDTGIEGMAMFFLIHQCTRGCSHLPKPTLSQFIGKIPDALLQEALAVQQLTKTGTTYSRESKFPPQITQLLVNEFLRIAQGRTKNYAQVVRKKHYEDHMVINDAGKDDLCTSCGWCTIL